MKIKFKGQVYDDARRSEIDGHIWFGKNEFEHIPEQRTPYYRPAVTYIHGFKQVDGRSWQRTSKKSSAKVEIIEEA